MSTPAAGGMFSSRTFGGGESGRRATFGSRHHLGIVAAAATLLATAPLVTLFERWSWLVHCLFAVAAVAAAAAGARALRVPAWGQPVAMLAALLLAVTLQFRSGEEFLLFPTPATFAHFNSLLSDVPTAVATQSPPVANHDGLLLLTMLGVGLVAILVDLLAVGLRRPALAGLPMLAIYSVPVAVIQQSVPAITFIIAVAGYLWLVATDNLDRVRRFGRRFTGDGRDVSPWDPSPLAAAGRRLTVIGLLIAVALPVAVPGMTTGLIDRFGSGFAGSGSGGSGGSPTAVNLFAHLDGLLNRDTTAELLQVVTDDPDPFYLRVGTAEQISSRGFDHRPPRGPALPQGIPSGAGEVPGVTRHEHNATVEVLGWDMNRLPTFAELTGVSGVGGDWRYDPDQQVVFSEETGAGGLVYELEYARREFDPAALRRAAPLPAEHAISRRFTEVISEPRVTELVTELTDGVDTPYDRVREILAHFSTRNGFRYSLETGSETTGSAIADFLFAHQAGFCVQYAVAMTWLVREAGLPARVAVGFTRGSQRGEGTYLLTNHNLHAWTEVYFDGFGWVPFDPTPSGSVSGSAAREWAPDPNTPVGTDTSDQHTDSAGAPLAPGDGPDQGPSDLVDELGGAVGGPAEEQSAWWRGALLAGLALLMVMLVMPALRRAQLRRRRTPRRRPGPTVVATAGPAPGIVTSGEPTAAARHWAHSAWDELLDTMVDFQVPLDATETPRTTVARLIRVCRLATDGPTPASKGVQLLGYAEERACYSQQPESPEGLLPALRAVRKELARQASTSGRLRARLLPPSILLRWRTQAADTISQVSLTASRFGQAVSPRRLLRPRSS